jgi:predicted PurR-regulated permease PerM
VNQLLGSVSSQEIVSQLGSSVTRPLSIGFQGALGVGATLFSTLFTLLTAVTILFYVVYDPNKIPDTLIALLPKQYQAKTTEIVHRIEFQLSKWLQGQLLLMVFMGIISYFIFLALGIPYPLILAILVGLLDIVPVVGPMIALVPILIVTVLDSPIKAIGVVFSFFLLQLIEGNVLVPRIMSKTVGLDSLYIIIALLVGSSFGGILGALLAIPGSVIVKILYDEWREHTKTNSKTK